MFDSRIRPYIDPPLNALGKRLAEAGVKANNVTIAGFGLAIVAFIALFFEQGVVAAVLVGLNRLLDGLDGAVARHSKQGATDLGGFLDIVTDFIFYAGIVFFFTLGRPETAICASFLIFSFMGTSSTFLAYAIIAQKRGLETEEQGEKSFFYSAGLAEGTETIVFLLLICLFPILFNPLAFFFGVACWVTAWGRVRLAMEQFRANPEQ